jgi:hypothetical protein
MSKSIAGPVAVAILSLTLGACSAGGTENGDLEISLKAKGEATAQEVGLPAYPGARAYMEPGDSSAGANLGLSTPLFGLQVIATDMQSADDPRKVAAFYKRALAKYGPVLDCSDGARSEQSNAGGSSDLVCEGDERGEHDAVYKVGTKNKQRIVAIKRHGDGTRFSLVYLNIRDDEQ